MNTGKIKGKYNIMLNQGYDGRDYQPYLTTTLPGSDRNSNTGDCGASLRSKPSHYQSADCVKSHSHQVYNFYPIKKPYFLE